MNYYKYLKKIYNISPFERDFIYINSLYLLSYNIYKILFIYRYIKSY